MKKVEIYTDGACSGNPGPGGWGAILMFCGREREISGYEPETTNNRMELTAAVEAMRALKEPCNVDLYSDSTYLVNGFHLGWLAAWKQNGWTNASGDDIKNQDLWKALDILCSLHNVNWNKVRGHSDNELNNRCDKLAVGEIRKNARKLPGGDELS